jgi:hypothetical protein
MNNPESDIRMATGTPMDSLITTECLQCNYQGPIAHNKAVPDFVCSDCLDAFEREDAPWEFLVTMGDITVNECLDMDDKCGHEGTEEDYISIQQVEWRCQRCGKTVHSAEVTYDEHHDIRVGGCGGRCL